MQEPHTGDPFHGRVGVGEVLSDVAERRRPEERVTDRVTDRVTVGMPREPHLSLEAHAAQPELTRRIARVHIEAETDANVSHVARPTTRRHAPDPTRW